MTTQEAKKRLINTSKEADKFLAELQPKQYKQVFTKLWDLRNNPTPSDSKKLSGFTEQLYRVTAGEFRIIYSFNDSIIEIMLVGKRNDDEIYKELKRKKT